MNALFSFLALFTTVSDPALASPTTGDATVPEQSNQTVSKLTEQDHARLQAQRVVVERYLEDSEENLRKYQTAAGKLGALRAILQAEIFEPGQTYELQCLGIVLGDVFVQEMEMEWVMVEDEYGRDPAVRLPGTSGLLFPLTMISKRIERGEKVDVFKLFNGLAAQIEEWQANDL